jgi:Holliday junction DNA helicase RuvB
MWERQTSYGTPQESDIMTYDEIIASLIVRTVENVLPRTHERVLIEGYTSVEAQAIAARLLAKAATTTVVFQEDDGTVSSQSLQCKGLSVGSLNYELVPFVVTGERAEGGSDSWVGSRGFASRIRDNFSYGVSAGTVRLLLLFDNAPVETERTASSVDLAETMDSVETLLSWLEEPVRSNGFAARVYGLCREVLRWWAKRLKTSPVWLSDSHGVLLERAVTFFEVCRASTDIRKVGEALATLGLVFRDPELSLQMDRPAQFQRRLSANADTAAFLDSIRRRRSVDAVIEADRYFDLGLAGDPFYDAMTRALRSYDEPITTVETTYAEIEARRRTNARQPVRFDADSLQFVGRAEDAPDSALELRWQFVVPPTDGQEQLQVVLALPSGVAELRAETTGNGRGFLFLDKVFHGAVNSGESTAIALPAPELFGIHEIVLKERNHPRARPTQVIRVAVLHGDAVAVPESAELDANKDAYLVDARLDQIRVQVGSREHVIDDPLPPDDGSPVQVEIEGARFRWAAEDRTPATPTPDGHGTPVRLLELHGVNTSGEAFVVDPVITASSEIAATNGRGARLMVPPDYLTKEAELLHAPESFVGMQADNTAARENIGRLELRLLEAWIAARQTFFSDVIAACSVRLGAASIDRPSLYLTNLTSAGIEASAREYVTTYCSILEAVREHVRGGSNSALVEPIVLCDRAWEGPTFLRIAPTHPLAVAFLAAVQHGMFSKNWQDKSERSSLNELFDNALLSGVLAWVPWRGGVLESSRSCPLLWREYGSPTSLEVDTDADLAQVLVAKTKRMLLSLSPHLNRPQQTLYVNIDLGGGTGRFVLEALRVLERDDNIQCRIDIGLTRSAGIEPALAEVFRGRLDQGDSDGLRAVLQGKVRVAVLDSIADREAHLAFRMTGPNSETLPFTSISEQHTLVRDCGFAGGLSQEPVRFAVNATDQVHYEQYVSTARPQGTAPASDDLWDGPWRRLWLRTAQLSRNLTVGLMSGVGTAVVPSRKLVQVARSAEATEYQRSFITVHCDPAQGPEFFVGPRSRRAGVYLVECSDRGSPELPGRDIVSVTAYIAPFRAALRKALEGLPSSLRDSVDHEVAKGLLRDINVLRGTEVFDFMREAAREEPNPVLYMEGLDNVLAMRLLLQERTIPISGALPIVVGLSDLTLRCRVLSDLRVGTKSDDLIVFYIPPTSDDLPVIYYRIVEVKFGPRRNQWSKAQRQLSETSRKLRSHLPGSIWREDPNPAGLLLQRDLAWVIHECIERYRAFGLLEDETVFERVWGLKRLFSRLNHGEFRLLPGGFGAAPGTWDFFSGTAVMLDPDVPGGTLLSQLENRVEYVTACRETITDLLVTPASFRASVGQGGIPSVEPETAPTPARPPSTPMTSEQTARREEIPHSVGEPAAEMSSPTPEVEPVATTETVIETSRARIEETFAGFVGNTGAVQRIKRDLRYAALENHNWLDPIGLFGPKSTGKTELATRISSALGVPSIVVSETTLTSADDLGAKIRETADSRGQPLRMENRDLAGRVEVAPPMVVFIDEVHLLKARVQDSLLKAMEPNDRALLTTMGEIDTHRITFIIATTDPGRLRDAFKSRVSKIDLREYTLEEVVEILKSHRDRGTSSLPEEAHQFDDEALRVVATVGRMIPRQALLSLKDAARALRLREVQPTAADLRRYFWETRSADEAGLTDRDWRYMQLLFPDLRKGKDALAAAMGEDPTTVELEIEPFLLRLGLIERERVGRCLTQQGREGVADHNRSDRDGQ